MKTSSLHDHPLRRIPSLSFLPIFHKQTRALEIHGASQVQASTVPVAVTAHSGLSWLATRYLAEKFRVSVVVTNQVTTRIGGPAGQPNFDFGVYALTRTTGTSETKTKMKT